MSSCNVRKWRNYQVVTPTPGLVFMLDYVSNCILSLKWMPLICYSLKYFHHFDSVKWVEDLCEKQVSRAGPINYIPQYLWDVITCPCPWYLLQSSQLNWCKSDYNTLKKKSPQQQVKPVMIMAVTHNSISLSQYCDSWCPGSQGWHDNCHRKYCFICHAFVDGTR